MPVTYKGLTLHGSPTGAGGIALDANFTSIADELDEKAALATANIFTENQEIDGNLTVASINATSIESLNGFFTEDVQIQSGAVTAQEFNGGSFIGDGSGLTDILGLWTEGVTATLDMFYGVNGTTATRTTSLTVSDLHCAFFDYDRSAWICGRMNGGLTAGENYRVFEPSLVAQYSIQSGWSTWTKGTTDSSPGDLAKGAVVLGYQNGVCSTYGVATGFSNIAVGAASFAGGQECISGNAQGTSGTGGADVTTIVSHDRTNKRIRVAGDQQSKFPNSDYIAFKISNGGSNATQTALLQVVSTDFNSTYSGDTCITVNKIISDFNADTNGQIINVTNGTLNSAFAFGKKVNVQSLQGVGIGESITLVSSGTNCVALGKSLTTTAGANGAVLLGEGHTVSSGTYFTACGLSHTNTTFTHSTALGREHTIGAHQSTAIGYGAKTKRQNGVCQAGGYFTAAGDAQVSRYVLRNSIAHTNTNWTPLYLDGSGIPITLDNNSVAQVSGMIVGQATTGTERFAFKFEAFVFRTGGTYSILSNTITTAYDTDNTSFDARVTNTGASISIEVQDSEGTVGGKTVKWVALVDMVEVVA